MKKLTDTNARPQIVGKSKKRYIPLSRLRTSDAVQVVSDSPRRLKELFDMLGDRDRLMRDSAASTLAQFASLHPSRLLHFIPRLREALQDESAYVRWHIVHTMGKLCELFPKRLPGVLPDLLDRLDDQNAVVQTLATKALARSAFHNPGIVEELFRKFDREIPRIINNVLRDPELKT
ncbi:MAG: HEAT repeat domain-containing protein [Acidobacteria bacterium]|nr:HEAT repeat domain-containing protein [Acidobacteriota bacterium]